MPYAGLSGIQAALAVMHRGLRPDIPSHTPASLAQLIQVGGVLSCHTSRLKCLPPIALYPWRLASHPRKASSGGPCAQSRACGLGPCVIASRQHDLQDPACRSAGSRCRLHAQASQTLCRALRPCRAISVARGLGMLLGPEDCSSTATAFAKTVLSTRQRYVLSSIGNELGPPVMIMALSIRWQRLHAWRLQILLC